MMNQRLKELREQAADFAEKAYDKQTMATFDTNKSAQELFEQKFAELIVRECADTAAGERSGWEARKAIEQHFGVE